MKCNKLNKWAKEERQREGWTNAIHAILARTTCLVPTRLYHRLPGEWMAASNQKRGGWSTQEYLIKTNVECYISYFLLSPFDPPISFADAVILFFVPLKHFFF